VSRISYIVIGILIGAAVSAYGQRVPEMPQPIVGYVRAACYARDSKTGDYRPLTFDDLRRQ